MSGQQFAISVLLACLTMAGIFGFVLGTGQTFGQRCALAYDPGTVDFDDCVQRLSHGRHIRPDAPSTKGGG